jgi:hypothetical protein
MDLFLPIFHLQDYSKSLPFPHVKLVTSSIIYGTTWTEKIQLQKSTTCHAINNVRCMDIFAPCIEITTVWEIKDLFSITGIKDGFGSQYSNYGTDFVWPSLEAPIGSFGCKVSYENHSM